MARLHRVVLSGAAATLAFFASSLLPARALDFEDRVEAQRAIERVERAAR